MGSPASEPGLAAAYFADDWPDDDAIAEAEADARTESYLQAVWGDEWLAVEDTETRP